MSNADSESLADLLPYPYVGLKGAHWVMWTRWASSLGIEIDESEAIAEYMLSESAGLIGTPQNAENLCSLFLRRAVHPRSPEALSVSESRRTR